MSLNIEQIEDKAKNRVSAYPEDLEDTLVAELIQFVAFMHTQKPASANESAELTMFKLLSSLYLSLYLCQTFPNVEIALRIYLCMMCPMPQTSGASQSWELSKESWGPQWVNKDLACWHLWALSNSMSCCAVLTSLTQSKTSLLLKLGKQQYKWVCDLVEPFV